MADFGQCSEPLCHEVSVRLFDCVHHCMKQVCLQHLIEHDRLIEHNQEYLDNLHTELKQLWITFSSLIDETKLHCEYEQKLKKHQQLIRDITNLIENNSINHIEEYRFMLEKLKQNIEQEKQLTQYSIEPYPLVERIKIEPIEENSSNDELDPLDIDLATRIKKLTKDFRKQKRKSITSINKYDHQMTDASENSDNETTQTSDIDSEVKDDFLNPSVRKLSGKCPLSSDGAYGLTVEHHGMYICPREQSYQTLSRHLMQFHKLTLSSAKIICQAIQNHQDPFETILFQSTDNVIDQINQYLCPFSIHNQFSVIKPNSSQRCCRYSKLQYAYTLRSHLIQFHRMTNPSAHKLINKLKEENP